MKRPQARSSISSPFNSDLHRSTFSSKPRARYGSASVSMRTHDDDDDDDDTKSQQTQTQSKTQIAATDASSDEGEVLMSMLVQGNKVGCAIYDPHTCKIMLLEDTTRQHSVADITSRLVTFDSSTADTDETDDDDGNRKAKAHSNDLIVTLLHRHRPALLLTSNKCGHEVRSLLQEELKELRATLQLRQHDEFDCAIGESVIHDRHIPILTSNNQGGKRSARAAPLGSLERLPLSGACAAALLSHMQRVERLADQDNEGDAGIAVVAIESFDVTESMSINLETATALGVFSKEGHATVFSQRTKEGYSLYALLSAGQSTAARALLLRWLTFPSLSMEVIQARLDAVELFTFRSYSEHQATRTLRTQLIGIRNIFTLAGRMVADKADHKTWKSIALFAAQACKIQESCRMFGPGRNISILDRILETCDATNLTYISEVISSIIDWEACTIEGRTVVRKGINEELDMWHNTLSTLPDLLAKVSESITESRRHPAYALTVEYFPQVGYLLAMRRKNGALPTHDDIQYGRDQSWTFQYASETHAYFKNGKTREMDTHIGDLHSLITGREIEIVQHLQEEVLRHLSSLIVCGDLLAELECLLAFANIADSNSYIRPQLYESPGLDIRDGRHPLQELIVSHFVPNDTTLQAGLGLHTSDASDDLEAARANGVQSVLIITGANACGKSVYVKQNALLVVMAQIGCFVPAATARIGLVDKILARVQLNETASDNQGSFQSDMRQVADALQRCTVRSLVIFDEMGKGTSSPDGAALFAATIRSMLRMGDRCPRVMAVTHFHEVFNDDLLAPSLPFTPAHMEILVLNPDDEDTDPEIDFLYKLRHGLDLSSHATHCERICGLPTQIVDRAEFVSRVSRDRQLAVLREDITREVAIADGVDPATQQTSTSKIDAARAERVAREFVAWDIEADRQAAAENGEMAWLDPMVKLTRILSL